MLSTTQANARDGNCLMTNLDVVFEHSFEKNVGDVNKETSPSSKTLI
jgi:hypothetical protein